MEKQTFKVSINAPRKTVWNVLWNDASYRAWTTAFSEGSRAETDGWKKGSKVLFLDARNNGMVSTVAENIPEEFMSFKHIGVVLEGVEDMNSAEGKEWNGSIESYALKPSPTGTELTVEMDVTEEYKDYFSKTWPKALAKIKELAEQH